MTAAVQTAGSAEARALTDRIKVAVEGTWHLITEAYMTRAWSALGYASWDDYCTREFGTSRLKLPREDRTETVGSLRSAGLSIPAIAAATGLGYGTVHRELSTDPNGQMDPAPYPNGQGEADDEIPLAQEECEALKNEFGGSDWADHGEADDGDQPDDCLEGALENRGRTIGVDGKSYPKPAPKPHQADRKPLKAKAKARTLSPSELVEEISELAGQSRSSRQIAAKLNITFERVRSLCRDYDINIPADAIVGRTKRINSDRVVNQIVLDADALTSGLSLVEFADLDPERIGEWVNSLSNSLRALSKFANSLKKELPNHG